MVMENCDRCGTRLETYWSTDDRQYRCPETGIAGIHLVGVEVFKCGSCGAESAALPNLGGLHELIAADLMLMPFALTGEEARFCRKAAGLAPLIAAGYADVELKTLRAWEAKADLDRRHDLLLRFLYLPSILKGARLAWAWGVFAEMVKHAWSKKETPYSAVLSVDASGRWSMGLKSHCYSLIHHGDVEVRADGQS